MGKVPSVDRKSKDVTKEANYRPEAWQGHLRGFTMGRFIKRQQSARDAEAKRKAKAELEEKLLLAQEPPVWDTRESTPVDMHYFPLEKGKARILPWFQESRDCECVQLCKWSAHYPFGDDTRTRKIIWILFFGVMMLIAYHYSMGAQSK